jgi:integrase
MTTTPNPVVPIPSVRKPRTKKASMDAAQLEKFLRAARDHGKREYAMFLLGFGHAMRASEICNLRISDVNFKNEQVRILRLKGSLDTTQALLRIKGNGLFDERSALRGWLSTRKADAADYVFNSAKSVKLNRVTVWKLFHKIATTAGLPEGLRHPHTLKHSTAMAMVRSGTGAFQIKQYMGHRSFDSTLQYIEVSDVDASAAFAKSCSMAF